MFFWPLPSAYVHLWYDTFKAIVGMYVSVVCECKHIVRHWIVEWTQVLNSMRTPSYQLENIGPVLFAVCVYALFVFVFLQFDFSARIAFAWCLFITTKNVFGSTFCSLASFNTRNNIESFCFARFCYSFTFFLFLRGKTVTICMFMWTYSWFSGPFDQQQIDSLSYLVQYSSNLYI